MASKIKTFRPLHRRTAIARKVMAADPFYTSTEWRAVREQVLLRDLYTCKYCGKSLFGSDATVDHIVARSEGGADLDPRNLAAACRSCNSSRGASVGNAYRARQ